MHGLTMSEFKCKNGEQFICSRNEGKNSRRIECVKMVHQVVMFICKMELGSKLCFLKEKRLLLLESVGWGVRKLLGMQNGLSLHETNLCTRTSGFRGPHPLRAGRALIIMPSQKAPKFPTYL